MQTQPLSALAHLLPDTSTFTKEGMFHIAGLPIAELVACYGTPLYLFDQQTITNACRQYQRAFTHVYTASSALILYAAKAYLSPLLAKLVVAEGLGLDVVSGGELLVAHKAGVPVERISFHGNNKSEEELRLAVQLGVGRIVLDNVSELERLTRIACEMGKRPTVMVRVAPDVATDTHPYLQTGHATAKFGFSLSNGEAKAALIRIVREGQLILSGLHAHCGTLLRDVRPYQETMERLFTLAGEVYTETGWWPNEISPGGGWGVDAPDEAGMPAVEVLAQALEQSVRQGMAAILADVPVPRLLIEPGRSIIARAGVALYRIGVRKPTSGGRTYLFVDGGMADNIRPALYQAKYTAIAADRAYAPFEEEVCIAGRYCESGDMLIERILLPRMREGDVLALPMAGAYCLPMASTYNLVPRPAVLLLNEGEVQVMERRETYEDLLLRYPGY